MSKQKFLESLLQSRLTDALAEKIDSFVLELYFCIVVRLFGRSNFQFVSKFFVFRFLSVSLFFFFSALFHLAFSLSLFNLHQMSVACLTIESESSRSFTFFLTFTSLNRKNDERTKQKKKKKKK